MDHFHLTPDQIGNLTEREISEYYFHEREKDGGIRPKETSDDRPVTYKQHCLEIDKLLWRGMIRADEAMQLKYQLKQKMEGNG